MKNRIIKLLFLSFFLAFIGCDTKIEPKCKYDYKIEVMYKSGRTDTISKKIKAPCNNTKLTIVSNSGRMTIIHCPSNRDYGTFTYNVEAYNILNSNLNQDIQNTCNKMFNISPIKPKCIYDYKVELAFKSGRVDTFNKKIKAPCNNIKPVIITSSGRMTLIHESSNRDYGTFGHNVESYKILNLNKSDN